MLRAETENGILIRPFKADDAEAAAAILSLAFQAKFQRLLGLPAAEIAQVMIDVGFVNQEAFQGYFVAEVQGAVAGVMVLRWQGQDKPKDKLDIRGFWQRYGLWKTGKMLLGAAALEASFGQDDCYIEHIAVSPQFRGLRVGTVLLNFAREFCFDELGKKRLTLTVAKDNQGAVRLYERLGFRVYECDSSLISYWLFGLSDWLEMAVVKA